MGCGCSSNAAGQSVKKIGPKSNNDYKVFSACDIPTAQRRQETKKLSEIRAAAISNLEAQANSDGSLRSYYSSLSDRNGVLFIIRSRTSLNLKRFKICKRSNGRDLLSSFQMDTLSQTELTLVTSSRDRLGTATICAPWLLLLSTLKELRRFCSNSKSTVKEGTLCYCARTEK